MHNTSCSILHVHTARHVSLHLQPVIVCVVCTVVFNFSAQTFGRIVHGASPISTCLCEVKVGGESAVWECVLLWFVAVLTYYNTIGSTLEINHNFSLFSSLKKFFFNSQFCLVTDESCLIALVFITNKWLNWLELELVYLASCYTACTIQSVTLHMLLLLAVYIQCTLQLCTLSTPTFVV